MHEFKKKEILKIKELPIFLGWEFPIIAGALIISQALTGIVLVNIRHRENQGVGVLDEPWDQILPIAGVVIGAIALFGLLLQVYRIIRIEILERKAQDKVSSLSGQTGIDRCNSDPTNLHKYKR